MTTATQYLRFQPAMLHLGRDLRRQAIEPLRGDFHRVRHGVVMADRTWQALNPTDRHAAFVVATVAAAPALEEWVLCRTSAAAMLGLPTISPWPDVVHVLPSAGMDRGVRRGTGPIVQRHVGEVGPTVVVHGVRVTSPARTIVDLALTGPLENAVAAGDFALSRGLMAHADLAAEIAAVPPGTRGLPGARLAVALDPARLAATLGHVGIRPQLRNTWFT